MIKYRLKSQGIDVLDTVLDNRGLDTRIVKEILSPSTVVIESPYSFKNMGKALAKVMKVMEENKMIAIPIDSDCDGWCSAGMLYHFIRYVLGYENIFYFFHDNPKAHGFTDHVVKKLKSSKADLVIMCDGGCGDADRKKYQTVLDNGTEIIVLDHHPFEGVYQDEVAIVNCHQKEANTNVNLSGAGVTHKFIEALSEEKGIPAMALRYRDLVALSLVSDLMDLRELENRVLLNEGIEIDNIINPFIKRLMETKKMDGNLTIEELGFNIAPLINATVRMGTVKEKEKVFRSLMGAVEEVESEKRGEKGKGIFVPLEHEAVRIATNLKSKQDKARDKGMETLLDEIDSKGLNKGKILIADVTDYIASEISGLVANKILDVVNKPVLLLRKNKEGDGYTGSARGLTESKELPSFKALCLNSKMFNFCAGHENAFGISISIPEFEKCEIKKDIMAVIKAKYAEELENGDISKAEVTAEIKSKTKEVLDDRREILLGELSEKLDSQLEGVEFFDGCEVDGVYNGIVPLSDLQDIANYEGLWCNNIKSPLFMVKDVKLKSADIEKVGNATYVFKLGDVRFTKNFGSKKWYSEVILEEELPFGGDLICDIVVKFRKNKRGYYYCDIEDMKSREDTEGDMDF